MVRSFELERCTRCSYVSFFFFFFLQKDFFALLTRNVVKRNDEDEIKIFKTQCHNVGTGMRFLKRRHQKMRDKVQDRVQRDCNNKFYIVE